MIKKRDVGRVSHIGSTLLVLRASFNTSVYYAPILVTLCSFNTPSSRQERQSRRLMTGFTPTMIPPYANKLRSLPLRPLTELLHSQVTPVYRSDEELRLLQLFGHRSAVVSKSVRTPLVFSMINSKLLPFQQASALFRLSVQRQELPSLLSPEHSR